MVDSNLLEPITSDPLARPEHVYLEPDFDLLGERALGEDCLHLQHHGGVNNHVTDFTIMEMAPTRAFSWLKVPTSALLRHYAKQVPRHGK